MEASFVPQSNHGIMDDQDELGSMSCFSNEEEEEEEEEEGGSGSSIGSSSSDSSSSSPLEGPLFEMSSLISQLPFKFCRRGLSVHFGGKSQSFTSLSIVKNLEDLVKPERPFRRINQVPIKSSKSYGWGLATTTTTTSHNKRLSPSGSSRTITKKKNSTATSKGGSP